MDEKMRKSGIDIIGDLPWGAHFCQFYQTKEDLMDILVPYFIAGLENNEFCMWITSQALEAEEAKKALRRTIPDFDVYLEKGQIEIIPYTYWYVKEGVFNSERILNGWVEKLNQALENGYEGLRLAGNTSWLEKENRGDFVDYEKKVDAIIDKHHVIAPCLYYLDMCSTAEIIDVISNHQFALIKRKGKWERIENSGRKNVTEREQEEHRIRRYNCILEGINRIFSNVVQAKTEEELGNACLSVALEVTGSQLGFINEMGADGLLHDVAKSELGWEQCLMYDKTGHRRPPGDYVVHGLYGSVVINEKSFFTNDPQSHPDSIGVPPGHPSLTSFLGVPLVQNGKTVGLIAVANRENGYSCEQKEDLEAIASVVTQALQRKKAEEALRLSNIYNRSLIEASLDPLVTIGPDGKITDVNGAAEQATGYSRSKLIETDFSDYFTEPEKARAGYQQVFTDGKVRDYPLEIQHKDGHITPVLYNASVYKDENGEVIGAFAAARDITERKRAERALRESEEKYRIVADNTFDWEFWLGPDGRFLYTSPSCERVTGYAAWEFIDKPDLLQEIIHPDDRQAFLQHQHDMPSSRHGDIEFRIVTKDGEIRWIHHLCQPLYDGEGRYAGSRGSNRETTERKRAEETLAFERSQLLSIFDGIDDVVYVTDPYTYKVLYANKAMQEKFGGELVGGICYWEFQRRDSPCDFCTNQIIFKERDKSYHWEYYNPTVGRYFMIVDRIIKWPDGRDVRFEIAKDITERKKAEEALRLSNLYNRSLIEASLDPLVTIGPDGKIMDVNGATEHATGYSRSELIGTDFSDYFTEPEKARTGYQQVFTHGEVRDYPLEIQHKDGHITPVLYNASVYRGENGEVIGVFAAARDITERQKAEEALKKAHDNLEEKVEERTTQLEKAYKSLKESENGLAEAQKMAHIGNWDWNIITNKLYLSNEVYRI